MHSGGYTGFFVPLNNALKKGKNEILVKVDNSHDPDQIPLKGDFNFYGGIYRDVRLYSLNSTHFELSEFGDEGVFITPFVNEDSASITVDVSIISDKSKKGELIFQVFDSEKNLIIKERKSLRLKKGKNEVNMALSTINQAQLWSPDNPNLYNLRLTIIEESNVKLDSIDIPFGLRYFSFDPDSGFYLKGNNLGNPDVY